MRPHICAADTAWWYLFIISVNVRKVAIRVDLVFLTPSHASNMIHWTIEALRLISFMRHISMMVALLGLFDCRTTGMYCSTSDDMAAIHLHLHTGWSVVWSQPTLSSIWGQGPEPQSTPDAALSLCEWIKLLVKADTPCTGCIIHDKPTEPIHA